MEYTILIADDDAELIKMLKTFFEIRKYRVITARNGTEALKMAEQAPDLILPDINMPGAASAFRLFVMPMPVALPVSVFVVIVIFISAFMVTAVFISTLIPGFIPFFVPA